MSTALPRRPPPSAPHPRERWRRSRPRERLDVARAAGRLRSGRLARRRC